MESNSNSTALSTQPADMWEIGKQLKHKDTNLLVQVVGKNLEGRPILERFDIKYGESIYIPTKVSMEKYVPYTPPPPNVKRYINLYPNGIIGRVDYSSLELSAKMAKENLADRLELELTHDGKFVSARSALLRSEGGSAVM
jgi:hypothetical protein